MKTLPFLTIGLLVSSISQAEVPTKLSCIETRTSQVCGASPICTAPPPQAPKVLGEIALTESSENGVVLRHGQLSEMNSSGGYVLTAEATVDAGGSDQPFSSVGLFVRETRGNAIRTIKLKGDTKAEFSYAEVRTSARGHESLNVTISCELN